MAVSPFIQLSCYCFDCQALGFSKSPPQTCKWLRIIKPQFQIIDYVFFPYKIPLETGQLYFVDYKGKKC